MLIPIGSELISSSGEIVTVVSETNKVSLNGQEMTLSAATSEIRKIGNPCNHWSLHKHAYNSKNLDDIYDIIYPAKIAE